MVQLRIQIYPLAYRAVIFTQPLPELPTLAILFLRELPQICGSLFTALAVRSSPLPQCATDREVETES
jgi:hypothetical protein